MLCSNMFIISEQRKSLRTLNSYPLIAPVIEVSSETVVESLTPVSTNKCYSADCVL